MTMSRPPTMRPLQVNNHSLSLWSININNLCQDYKHLPAVHFADQTLPPHSLSLFCLIKTSASENKSHTILIVFFYDCALNLMAFVLRHSSHVASRLQAMRTWRPSLPGTTRPSGRPSSGRYAAVFPENREKINLQPKQIISTDVSLAGLRHPHGPAARHCRHRRPLLILVSPVLYFTLFFYTLTHDNSLVVVCLPSAPVRFFIQTHPGLYMAS